MSVLIINHTREIFTNKSTISTISIDGKFICYALEDTDRRLEAGGKKIYGETAIPLGKYQVIINMSPRFKKLLPLLLDVPQFTGVRIHPGNEPKNTEGCILPGTRYSTDWVSESGKAFDILFKIIKDAIAQKQTVLWDIRRKT